MLKNLLHFADLAFVMRALFILFFLFNFAGCLSGSNGSPSEKDHLGVWKTSCVLDKNETLTESDDSKVIHTMLVDEFQIDLKIDVYPKNSDCASSDWHSRFHLKSNYTRSLSEYTTTLIHYEYTPKAESILSLLNPAFFCGTNAWEVGVSANILDDNCFLSGKNYSKKFGDVNIFNAFRTGDSLKTTQYQDFDYLKLSTP